MRISDWSSDVCSSDLHQHIADVKASVPAEQLLVYSVDQGWAPLCAFLGVPEPGGEFPNVNDRAALKQVLKGMTRGALSCSALARWHVPPLFPAFFCFVRSREPAGTRASRHKDSTRPHA